MFSVSPDIAPFQFSSSSLSAALSDPPQNPKPLPPIQEPDPPPSASPSPYNTYSDDFFYEQMSQDDFPQDQLELAHILSGTHFDSHGFIVGAQNMHLSLPTDMIPSNIYDGWDNLLPDIITSPSSTQMPLQSLPGLPIDHHNLADDISSTLSTPSFFHASLSSSPNAPSPIELSPNEHGTGSLLFSPDLQPPPPKRLHRKSLKKPNKPPGPTRLSSMLPLTPE